VRAELSAAGDVHFHDARAAARSHLCEPAFHDSRRHAAALADGSRGERSLAGVRGA